MIVMAMMFLFLLNCAGIDTAGMPGGKPAPPAPTAAPTPTSPSPAPAAAPTPTSPATPSPGAATGESPTPAKSPQTGKSALADLESFARDEISGSKGDRMMVEKFDMPVKKEAGKGEAAAAGTRPSRTAATPSASGLKAGFADDNKQFNYFVDFLRKYAPQVQHYPLPIEERIILKVKDKDDKSIANAGITIYDGQQRLCGGKTYADGTFLFFPSEHAPALSRYRAVVACQQGREELTIDRQGPRELTVRFDRSRIVAARTPLDILFVMDTTGSMGEEINRLKNTIEIINLNLTSLSSRPLIRFGMVLYKDRGDAYVTRVIPLTEDLEKFRAELNRVQAGGGGDNPEDLQSALKDGIEKISWHPDAIRLCYIITDAAAHLDYGQTYTYVNAVHDAREMGLKMFTIGTGGLDISGEYLLRQISQYTYAKYIFLTYGERGEAEGGKEGSVSHHTGANFQTDKLESIIIRFTKEELSYLSDQPLTDGDAYFQAVSRDDEKKDDTLQKLFAQATAQLIDYSSLHIDPGTPASLIPFLPAKPEATANAEYFTEQMGFSLSKIKTFRMVERKDMQKIFDELKLQGTGIVDDRSAAAAGKLMGARMIIVGKLYLAEDNYELFLKLLRVETGEVLAVNKLKIDRKLGL